MGLVTLRSYRDPIDARLAQARLELEGIPSALRDEHVIAVQWLWSRALGGVKLVVDEAHLEAARRLLAADESGDLAAVEDACPDCGSTRIHSSKVQRRTAALSLLTSLPLVFWRDRWRCEDCGYAWRDDEGPPEEFPEETLAAERAVQRRHPYPGLRVLLAVLAGLAVLVYVEWRIRNP